MRRVSDRIGSSLRAQEQYTFLVGGWYMFISSEIVNKEPERSTEARLAPGSCSLTPIDFLCLLRESKL